MYFIGRNGMSTLDEYRGLSYATGGDNNTLSLFNFINRFSPNVLGASTGKHLAELPGWVLLIICRSRYQI